MVILRDKIRFYEGRSEFKRNQRGFIFVSLPAELVHLFVPSWLTQVRSYSTLWLRLGTFSSVTSSPCCRLFFTQFRCTTTWSVPSEFFFFSLGLVLNVAVIPQGKEPSVRQLALLHFRNTIVLSVKLEDALSRPRARVPPSVTQMLLILQVSLQTTNQTSLSIPAVFVGNSCIEKEPEWGTDLTHNISYYQF